MELPTQPSTGASATQPVKELVGCRVCGQPVRMLLDFGRQPLCNRLLNRPSVPERSFPVQLGQCPGCGLLQLMELVAVTDLKPAKPLRYTEPESHLDQVADLISKLPGIHLDSTICGVTAKDQSTIDRLAARGFRASRCLQAADDLGIEDPSAGIETVQQRICAGELRSRGVHCGRYQVVIVRHVLEHAQEPRRFLAALQSLLVPGGFLVVEVPDFTSSLLAGDYCTLWEEHVVYYTSGTLSQALKTSGFSVSHLQTYPYVPENSLVVVATGRTIGEELPAVDPAFKSDGLARELELGRQYAVRLPGIRQRWRERLLQERAGGKQVAMLGAGHLGIMFLNLMDLADMVDFAIDDDLEKCGRYLPGTQLEIRNSTALAERTLELCLLSISPEGEDRVRQRQPDFVDRGGRFCSIFPGSRWAYFPGSSDAGAIASRKD